MQDCYKLFRERMRGVAIGPIKYRFDNLQTVPKGNVGDRISHLTKRKLNEAAKAISFALGFDADERQWTISRMARDRVVTASLGVRRYGVYRNAARKKTSRTPPRACLNLGRSTRPPMSGLPLVHSAARQVREHVVERHHFGILRL